MPAHSRFEKIIFALPAYAVCFFLIAPFFLFCLRLNAPAWPLQDSFFSVFSMTLLQAGVSTALSLFFGLLGSRGLLALAKRGYFFVMEGIVLLPALLPPLLLVLSLTHLTEKITPFPFGLTALIAAQTLTYTGLCSVAFARCLLKEAPHLSEWAYLQDSSAGLFLKALLSTVLRKDIKILAILVFSSSFASLSLPLLAGANPSFSLEFFIYENLKDPQLWPQAFSLILFQSLFIFLICWKAFSGRFASDFKLDFKKIYLLPQILFLAIPLGAVFCALGGLFFISDSRALARLFSLKSLILSSSLKSLLIGVSAGALILLLLILMALSFQNLKARKFIASFAPPGVSFMGFAFLILPFYGEGAVLMKWIGGLSLLLFPLIYRFQGERALERLSDQVETARFLGAGWGLIFRDILWPQSRSAFFLCAGLAGFWACGDFSYSLIVSSGHWSLSLLVYDLFSSYRLDEAILLSWLLLFLSFSVFLFWLGVSFVFSKKFIL